jgi:hypothetical protein
MRKPKPATGWRKALESFNKGLMFLLKPLQIVSNFVFLTLAYVLGVGLSALFYRIGSRRRREAEASVLPNSYWRPLPPAETDLDAWLRPF